MCRYSSNVTHVWRAYVTGGAGGPGARIARVDMCVRVCVRPGRGRGRAPHRRGRPLPADRTPPTERIIRHSRDTAAPRARLDSFHACDPPATHVRRESSDRYHPRTILRTQSAVLVLLTLW